MIPDFLCRKIKCFYCNNVVKRKDATVVSIIVQGELQEQQRICLSCATMIEVIKKEMDEKNYLYQFLKPKWAIKQIIRYDRGNLVEDICEHGIGHPNSLWLERYGIDSDNVHGCDGCCSKKKEPKLPDTVPFETIDSIIAEEKKKSLKKTSKKATKKKKKDKIYSAEPLKIVKL